MARIIRTVDTESIKPRFPEIGRLFTGSPKGTSKRRGFDGGDDLGAKGFRLALSETLSYQNSARVGFANMKEDLEDRIRSKYNCPDGDTLLLKSLSLRFPYEKQSDFLSYGNEEWKAFGTTSVCTRRCDGSTCSLHIDENSPKPRAGEKPKIHLSQEPIPCSAGPDDTDCPKGCKSRLRLEFAIADVGYPTGVVVFNPTGIINIQSLISLLKPYEGMDVRNLLFRLTRTPTTFKAAARDGSTVSKSYHKAEISLDPGSTEAYQQAKFQFAAAAESSFRIASSPSVDGVVLNPISEEVMVIEGQVDPEFGPTLTKFSDLLERATSPELIDTGTEWIMTDVRVKAIMDEEGISQLEAGAKIESLKLQALERFAKA